MNIGFRKRVYSWGFPVISLVVILALTTANIMPAMAYIGTGLGTLQNPYKIANCAQLQDIENSLSAHYKLTSDIDCSATSSWNSGAGFVPITAFTGVLDGQNFSVNNLYQNTGSSYAALFTSASNATIKNIHLRGGSFNSTNPDNSYSSASFVVDATNTAFSNCSSTVSIANSAGSAAGLVGSMTGGSIDSCWYDGTVTSNSYYGAGIASFVFGTAVISNVYSKGSVTGTGSYGAGLIGLLTGSASVANAYSTATVVGGGADYTGGLIGVTGATASITNVFYAGVLNPGSSTGGAIIGARGGTGVFSGAYYDIYTCGCSTGVGFGINTTTSVNGSNATPNYFKDNSTNAPLAAWNFTSVWQTNTGDYPSLRSGSSPTDGDSDGATNSIESSAPNSGDGNGDGISDAAQTNVASLVNPVTSQYATMSSTCDSSSGVSVNAESVNSVQDTVFSYPLGLMSFTLQCNTIGQTATVSQYYYYTTDPGAVVARKYNTVSGTYQAITGATIERVTIGGQTAIKVTYVVTDGGSLDEDGVANGVIVDPFGLAKGQVTAPNTGLGGTAGRY